MKFSVDRPYVQLSLSLLCAMVGLFGGIAESHAQAWSSCTPPGPGTTPEQFCSCYGANQGTQDGIALYASWQPPSESACQDKSSLTAYSGAINLAAASIIEGVVANIAAGNLAALPNVSPDPSINNDTGYIYGFLRGSYDALTGSPSPAALGAIRDKLVKRAGSEIKEVTASMPIVKYSPPQQVCEAPLGVKFGHLNPQICANHPYIVYWLDTSNYTVAPNGC